MERAAVHWDPTLSNPYVADIRLTGCALRIERLVPVARVFLQFDGRGDRIPIRQGDTFTGRFDRIRLEARDVLSAPGPFGSTYGPITLPFERLRPLCVLVAAPALHLLPPAEPAAPLAVHYTHANSAADHAFDLPWPSVELHALLARSNGDATVWLSEPAHFPVTLWSVVGGGFDLFTFPRPITVHHSQLNLRATATTSTNVTLWCEPSLIDAGVDS